MRVFLLIALTLLLVAGLSAQAITCRDVQYTAEASGISPLAGQVVTVQGVVVQDVYYSGSSTSNRGFFISDPEGGPWSGLLIFTNSYFPQIGDLVEVTGTIYEYFQFTEMSPTNSCTVLSQGNPLPLPTLINTGNLTASDAEQWESVFVKVEDVNVTASPDGYLQFYVNDGSGACQIDDQCFPRSGFSWPSITVGQSWARIQGVVDYSYDEFGIQPRNLQDLVQIDTVANATVKIQTTNAELNQQVMVNILTSRVKPQWGVASYHARIRIDPNRLLFHGVETMETMSIFDPVVTVSAAGDSIDIVYQSQEPINSATDDQTLLKLILEPITYGESLVQLLFFSYDNTNILGINSGKVLTAIKRKIAWLNITSLRDYASPGQDVVSNKNIFNPALNEKIQIEYGCKNVATGINVRAYVRIYDAQGRLVSTPVNRNISNSLGIESTLWDGRDTNMKLLPIGLYYVHLEVVDRATGAKETTVQPVVIKSVLK